MAGRAVLIVGMHRSGTSAVTRGLQALSVYLGDNFFDLKPDNPTGYWEDKAIVEINQRTLEELRLTWDDTTLIARDRLEHYRIRLLKLKALRYLEETFASQPLWGFKDPRTIRLLPLWIDAIAGCGADAAYVVAIRHPRSVAASLLRRQEIQPPKAHRLWLVHNVPFLSDLRDKRFVVVDYDLLTEKPRAQLERIARRLDLPIGPTESHEIDRFATEFLDEKLRHNVFRPREFDTGSDAGLAQRAYLLLYELATDRRQTGNAFWSAWDNVLRQLEVLDRTP